MGTKLTTEQKADLVRRATGLRDTPAGRVLLDVAREHSHLFEENGQLSVIQVGGRPILIAQDNPLIEVMAHLPNYSSELGRLARHVFSGGAPGGFAIDVGANVGDTLAIIKAVADVPVIAVEGDPRMHGLLAYNAAQFSEVRLFPCFLAERRKSAPVTFKQAGTNTIVVPAGDAEKGFSVEEISFRALDELVEEEGIPGRCRLLKVDAEGFDPVILRGAGQLLRRDRPAVMFEYNHYVMAPIGEDGMSLFAQLRECGYDDLFCYDHVGRFMFHGSLNQTDLLQDISDYVQGLNSAEARVVYCDFCAFHADDRESARRFAETERAHRRSC